MSEESKPIDTVTETVNTDTETETITGIENMSDEEFSANYENIVRQYESEGKSKEDTTEPEEPVDTKSEEPSQNEETPSIDYEDVYNKIFSGFKANGKELKPETVEDVISLMQMGANYGKKMKNINDRDRQIKSLNEAGITTAEDISFLIDLAKGDTEAIKKLLKDKNIDIYDLDIENTNYESNTKNIISNDSYNFLQTLDEIKDSEHFTKIYDVVDNKWDKESKNVLLHNPKVLEGLKQEFELGRFEEIQEEVNRQRQFGRLSNMNDLDAYTAVLQKHLFNKGLIDENGNWIEPKPKSEVKVTVKDVDTNKASTKPTQSSITTNTSDKMSDKDIAKLSDEEFMKLYNKGYFE